MPFLFLDVFTARPFTTISIIMLTFLLLYLLGLTFVNSTVLSLPGHLRNGTELFDLSNTNATVTGNDYDPTNNASSLGTSVDKHFRTVIDNFPDVRISGKSTYMSILKAMIALSYGEGTHAYAGETFSFRDYTNVKIRITRATPSSSTLQYRYAIWGLFKAAQYLTSTNVFTCIIVSLYWDGSGVPVQVGTIEILPDPLPDIASSTKLRRLMRIGQQAETPSNFSDMANFASIENKETDLTAPGKFIVFLELQGQILSIKEVFMTLFLGLLHIASFRTDHIVHDFVVRDSLTRTELRYENYGAPRTSPPLFTYHAAARALAHVPKFMFAQSRFEAVTFVLEIGGTPVGTGYLKKFSTTLDKVQGQ